MFSAPIQAAGALPAGRNSPTHYRFREARRSSQDGFPPQLLEA
jgi:hypothetical protein